EIEPSVTDLLSKTNLTDTLDKFSKKKNISKYERSLLIDLEINSRKFVPLIQEIEARLTNGTFIDDRMLYVRWVDDYMGYGLFAGRDLKSGDLIGIYNGVYSRAISDAEYEWEYAANINLKDESGKPVRVYIDQKDKGNYLRFVNHRDFSLFSILSVTAQGPPPNVIRSQLPPGALVPTGSSAVEVTPGLKA
ncbi:hypothetical protein G9A89_000482, partial [Geosiphon pyriformis]